MYSLSAPSSSIASSATQAAVIDSGDIIPPFVSISSLSSYFKTPFPVLFSEAGGVAVPATGNKSFAPLVVVFGAVVVAIAGGFGFFFFLELPPWPETGRFLGVVILPCR